MKITHEIKNICYSSVCTQNHDGYICTDCIAKYNKDNDWGDDGEYTNIELAMKEYQPTLTLHKVHIFSSENNIIKALKDDLYLILDELLKNQIIPHAHPKKIIKFHSAHIDIIKSKHALFINEKSYNTYVNIYIQFTHDLNDDRYNTKDGRTIKEYIVDEIENISNDNFKVIKIKTYCTNLFKKVGDWYDLNV